MIRYPAYTAVIQLQPCALCNILRTTHHYKQNPVTHPLKSMSRLPKPMSHHMLTKSHAYMMHTKNNVCLPIIDLEVVAVVPVAAAVGAAVGAEPVIIDTNVNKCCKYISCCKYNYA